MATHLAHRLPWASFGEVVKCQHDQGRDYFLEYLPEPQAKTVRHFARCLSDAIKEFAETDRTPDDEKEMYYDASKWGIEPHGHGGYMGYYISLLKGYVVLNLILIDPDVFVPIVSEDYTNAAWVMNVLCGHCDGGHPDWIATRLRPAFDNSNNLKPLTAEVVQILRDHCALLFRCLYSISEGNRALDPEYVASMV